MAMANGVLAFMKDYGDLIRHEGNRQLFEAVEMSIISQLWGEPLHLHAEGVRGTGKTTILRAARRILPTIERIRGCPYNCDPRAPHCPLHAQWTPEQIRAHGVERVPMPFREISPSAKIGTITGSLDLARLTDRARPEAALLPGTLAQAHRGIVFVDEINRLADVSPELVDCLLDVMGTKPGRLQIEETGLPPVELPVRVAVWAASNPDEEPGPLEEIRRQLSDRFDLVLDVRRPAEVWLVKRILQMGRPRAESAETEALPAGQVGRTSAGAAAGAAGHRAGSPPDPRPIGRIPAPVRALAKRSADAVDDGLRLAPRAGSMAGPPPPVSRPEDGGGAPAPERSRVPDEGAGLTAAGAGGDGSWLERWQRAATARPRFPDPLLELLAEIYVQFRLESLRALEAWRQAATLYAVRGGRETVLRDDLLEVAPAVLRHRVDAAVLAEVLEYLSRDENAGRTGSSVIPAGADGSHGAAGLDHGSPPAAPRWPGATRSDQAPGPVNHWAPEADSALAPFSPQERVSERREESGGGAATRVWGRFKGMLIRAAGISRGSPAGGPSAAPPSDHQAAVAGFHSPAPTSGGEARRPVLPTGGTPPRRARPLLELSRDRVIRAWTGM